MSIVKVDTVFTSHPDRSFRPADQVALSAEHQLWPTLSIDQPKPRPIQPLDHHRDSSRRVRC